MRRFSWFQLVGVLLLVIGLMLSGCSTPKENDQEKAKTDTVTEAPEQQPVNLKYGGKNAPTSFMSKIDIAMFEKIEKETNGKVKITPYWAQTLVKSAQWYTETVNGTSDITHVLAGANEEHLPLYVASTNFLFDVLGNSKLREAAMELWKQKPELMAEWKNAGVVPLSWNSPGQVWLHSNKPVRSLDDLKGMTINVTDDNTKGLAQSLGVNTVRMTLSESYSALQKGIIDGMATGYDALTSFKLGEVTKYSTALPYTHPHIVIKVMSINTWNNLSPDTQKVFEENGRWWDTEFIKERDKLDQATTDWVQKNNHEIIKLPPADEQKIKSILEENSKKRAEETGTMEIYNAAREIAKKYVK